MKIGFDAKWFFYGPISNKKVVSNILIELIKLNTRHEIFIFLRKTDQKHNFPLNNPNIKLIYIWGRNTLISNIFIMPFYAYKLKLDFCVCQNFSFLSTKIKVLTYIHDISYLQYPEYFSLLERLYFTPIKFFASRSQAILTISNTEKSRLLNYKFKKQSESIKVIYNAVDESYMDLKKINQDKLEKIRSNYKLPNRFVLFLGRLNVRKNLKGLIESIQYWEENNLKLVIVGEPNWKSEKFDYISNNRILNNKILFTGYISDEDLPYIYNLAELLCFPSFDEGFGLPVLEAMACGLCVAVSDIPVMHEICREAGTYFNPSNPFEIAQKINILTSNSYKRNNKRDLGLSIAKEYNWNNSAQKLMDLIQ